MTKYALVWILAFSVPAAAQTPSIALEQLVTGLNQPVALTHAHDGTGRKFIAEQNGLIVVMQAGGTSPTLFLDIRSRVLTGTERGLLGLAFHPQYSSNRRFFVSYTRQPDGALVIAEYRASATDPNVADSNSEIIWGGAPHTATNHNGGGLAFGPGNILYAGLGDGGTGDPIDHGQTSGSALGKIFKYWPDRTSGLQSAIFASGVRNPAHLSVDQVNGLLYADDVGDSIEEINVVTARGANLGSRVMEGNQCTSSNPNACTNPSFVAPLLTYTHSDSRCAVVGGHVYRGRQRSLPYGTYIFGDRCTGEIFAYQDGAMNVLLDSPQRIAAIGEDESGELYVLDPSGSAFRITTPSVTPSNSHLIDVPPNGAMFLPVGSTTPGLVAGFADIQASIDQQLPDALGFLRYRQNGILLSEVSLRASPLMTSGRLLVKTDSTSKTAIAVTNSNPTATTMTFYFTNAAGQNFGQGSTSIPAGAQLAAFLDQSPFNGSAVAEGNFTFSTTAPVSVLGLQGIFNARSDFLMSNLPVVPLSPVASNLIVLPEYVSGAGWTTEFALVNPLDQAISGNVQLWAPDNRMIGNFPYSIPPGASQRITPPSTGTATTTQTGYGLIVPSNGGQMPAGFTTVRFLTSGGVGTEAVIPATYEGSSYRIYAEMSQTVQNAITVSNLSWIQATMTVTLTALDGSAVATGSFTVPAKQQRTVYLHEVPGLESAVYSFQGVVQIRASTLVGVSMMRSRVNERGETLLTPMAFSNETRLVSIFPRLATGAGFETDLVWVNTEGSARRTGTSYFYSIFGSSLPLTIP